MPARADFPLPELQGRLQAEWALQLDLLEEAELRFQGTVPILGERSQGWERPELLQGAVQIELARKQRVRWAGWVGLALVWPRGLGGAWLGA